MKKRFYSILRGVRNRHVLGVDMLLFFLIPSAALLMRVESFDDMAKYDLSLAVYTSLSIVWKISIFLPFGLYRRYWRYASVDELSIVVLANLASLVFGIAFVFLVLRPAGWLLDFPRSIPIMDGLLTLVCVGGFRFLLRLGYGYKDESVNGRPQVIKKRGLIVGAGAAGSMIVKELNMNPSVPIAPIGFLDDDFRKQHARIHGVPVVGKLSQLPEVVQDLHVQEVIIAMPTALGGVIRDVVHMCKEVGVPSRTIPGIFEILSGHAHVSQIRDVQIEDLLRREVVQTDTVGVANLLRSRRVMVTGAGGSIGSELARQIAQFNPETIMLLGHGENSVFDIAKELRSNQSLGLLGKPLVQTIIADVRDRERMRQVFQLFRPEIVFHAAAHKHVGLMEENIPDAVTNNVLGTKILAELADQYGVERFVMISSDKAVNPTSIMGVTKRVAELLVGDVAQKKQKPFVSVRFGNVLGSRGSVVPIFKSQIAAGGPVCITHPEATRYFMTIPEAVQLVLQAATMGQGGEVFVLDMGEPVKILDLASDMIRLSGFREGEDINILFTGLKHGEKMHEELFFEREVRESSEHKKILVCRNSSNGESAHPEFAANIDRLVAAAQHGASKNVKAYLKLLVPEFQDKIEIPEATILPMKREAPTGVSLVEQKSM